MTFELNEIQQAIKELAQKVCEGFPDEYWLNADEEATFPHHFHRAVADAGLLGVAMPEQFGGSGLGITEAAILVREISESGAGMSGACRFPQLAPGRDVGPVLFGRAQGFF